MLASLREHLLDPIADDIDASLRLLQHHSSSPGLAHKTSSSSGTGAASDTPALLSLPSLESAAQCQGEVGPNAKPFLELKPLQLCNQLFDARCVRGPDEISHI